MTSQHLMDTHLTSSLAPTAAEREVARVLANEITHAIVVAASEPDSEFPEGSLAERLRRKINSIGGEERENIRRRATMVRSKPNRDRPHFLRSPLTEHEARMRITRRGPSGYIRELMKWSATQRADNYFGSGQGVLQWGSGFLGQLGLLKTQLEAVIGAGSDVETSYGHTVSLTTPKTIDFHWVTEEEQALNARWELRELNTMRVLASGEAGTAPGGYFRVDFSEYLVPEPPETPHIYTVRVQPFGPKRVSFPSGSDETENGDPLTPSSPVRIVYSRDGSLPQVFHFPEVYRKLTFVLDRIRMVDDQYGPGNEEFVVFSFVQEMLGIDAVAGQRHKLPTRTAELEPEPGDSKEFDQRVSFHLNNPSTPDWPRVYTAVLVVLEDDDGGAVRDLLEFAWDQIVEYLGEGLVEAIRKVLKELGLNKTMTEAASAATAGFIASAISGGVAGIVLGMIAAAIANIIGDMKDDMYGSGSHTLVLTDNTIETIMAMGGEALPDGGWHLPQKTLRFKGAPGETMAAAWDGVVDIDIHWELSAREIL